MLRSLVGSEMCIRDSLEMIRSSVAFMKSRGKEVIYDGEHFYDGYKANPCLLYTSDAADDLLCVDIGGRRINKKKTKNINTT